jgi:hypothetical protein
MKEFKIANIGKYKLTAVADTPDFRDWSYQPALLKLAKKIDRPVRLKVLDQGEEGSCTGFALAAVINLLRQRSGNPGGVSARMLYEMAKRHDEWPGYRYEGSSCRGAIKGWYNMGVCLDSKWPYVEGKPGYLTVAAAKDARSTTLGAYYRLGMRISDFHAALNEAGVIYCSADIHEGWDKPGKSGVIPFAGESLGGHAFAIIGYDKRGFWIQNSWTRAWGDRGTALWTYEDWQQNISDAWVQRLAVPTPQIWHLPPEGGSDAGRAESFFSKTPTRAEIAGHFAHIDDGQYHDHGRYWSNERDVQQTAELLASSTKYDHLLLYAHGGLNSAEDSAQRISAMKETFKANRIYPFHFMYDTGLLEELKDVLVGKNRDVTVKAGGLADWTDHLIERGTRIAGRALWRQMKLGAERPFRKNGAGLSVLRAFLNALDAAKKRISIHIVGHSTGAILHAQLLAALAELAPRRRISSASLLAPATSLALFDTHYRPMLSAGKSQAGIDRMDIYILSEKLEQDDSVIAVYRKSLLYLVSRAFEEDPLPVSLVGMEQHSQRLAEKYPTLSLRVSHGKVPASKYSNSESHGGFDNDPLTMNAVLRRILGKKPPVPFTAASLKY